MRSSKPVIAVTGPAKGGWSAWIFTAFALWMQGGRPVRVYSGKNIKNWSFDGIVLGGGADINPEKYGELLREESNHNEKSRGIRAWAVRMISIIFYPLLFVLRNIFSTGLAGTDTARDELELQLLNNACQNEIPVLGICRGAQLINVKFGGTLHQDIGGFYSEVPRVETIWPRKSITISAGSKLNQFMQTQQASVNAMHHQAVRDLGDALCVSAKEKNGIIQGIEHPAYAFLLGVQWHPEYLPQIYVQRRIFERLVEAGREHRAKSES